MGALPLQGLCLMINGTFHLGISIKQTGSDLFMERKKPLLTAHQHFPVGPFGGAAFKNKEFCFRDPLGLEMSIAFIGAAVTPWTDHHHIGASFFSCVHSRVYHLPLFFSLHRKGTGLHGIFKMMEREFVFDLDINRDNGYDSIKEMYKKRKYSF